MNAVRPCTVDELPDGTNANVSRSCCLLTNGNDPTWKIGFIGESDEEIMFPWVSVWTVCASVCPGEPAPVVGEIAHLSDAE